ncbi:subunit beta of T-complex protein 1 [Hamiltosporidium tvaerminnensis]|uniref:Subunit beta of T-complex protein 1 n=1 Tax=Hamiltosporidium tvaerminnensis TaxID=1176355 RepID=A0A4Q9KTC7_9MICR|nr:T-complex protein 1 subunit beta [Hamiltosporidium tvaerminnensis]TBT98028.1 subunit beta of T-complex protein 1 [Hamiltosporidium tvaerminnensis]
MNIYTHNNLGTSEERSEEAQKTIIGGVDLLIEILRSALGPKGALKLLTGTSPIISNDGATILKNLLIDSPSAQILIDASVSQDWEEGDGTTSVALLAALLIKEVQNIGLHPCTIIKGYHIALTQCIEHLKKLIFEMTSDSIQNLAETTLCSKILKPHKKHFANICVSAISRIKKYGCDLNLINIIKIPGTLEDSYIDDGFILKKDIKVPFLKNPKILVGNTSLDSDKVKINAAKFQVQSIKELVDLENEEKIKMKKKVEKICSNGVDCFINRQIIYDFPLQLFSRNNVTVIEHADFDGVERLVKFVGGKIMSTFDSLNEDCYGSCKEIRNIVVDNERMIKFFVGNEGDGPCTIVLKGGSKEMLDEAERSIHDVLCVLKGIYEVGGVVCGGGAIEMSLALMLNDLAIKTAGKESEAILAFMRALIQIPFILAENAGFDANNIKSILRKSHSEGKTTYGIDMDEGVCCMKEKGVVESLRVKRRVLVSACEVAQMIIKCDGVVKCKPRERTRE